MDKKISPFPKALLLAALAGLPAIAAAAPDLDGLARQLAAGAHAAGLHRVAVSRLEPPRGHDDSRADGLTDDLTVALVRAGGVQAVERAMIGKIAEEIKLDRTGAVAGASEREARLSSIDALVVGRYESTAGRLRVFARLVDAQTGVIIAAASAELVDEETALRDAVSSLPPSNSPESQSCAAAAQSVTNLQETLLDLKARYWAFRLRLGVEESNAADDARATIPDSHQRERYMDALASWKAADIVPPLRVEEIGALEAAQLHAKNVVRDCRL